MKKNLFFFSDDEAKTMITPSQIIFSIQTMTDVCDNLRTIENLMYHFTDAGDFKNARDCWTRWTILRQHPSCNRLTRTGCSLALEMNFVMEQLEMIGEKALDMHALYTQIQRAAATMNFNEAIQLRAQWDVTYSD